MTVFGFRYPAVILLGFTVAGTLIGRAIDFGLPATATGALVAGMALLFAYLCLPGRFFIIALSIFVTVAAAAHAGCTFHIRAAHDIGNYAATNENIRFFANVVRWPVLKRHKTVLTCRVDSVMHRGIVFDGTGLIHLVIRQETTRFAYGDRICFEGKLERPFSGLYPGQFDYARYLYNQGVRGTVTLSGPGRVLRYEGRYNFLGRTINAVRSWTLACFRKNLTEVPSALASGFLIGETKEIPDPIYQAFRRTGTMHLLAVSGSNVALVLAAAYFALRAVRLRRVVRSVILIGIIVVFSHLSYNQPSVVRASIMAGLLIGGRVLYRRIDLNNIIAAAAVILILSNPSNLFDIGFQLSFAVTWGLILFLPELNYLIERMTLSRPVKYILLIAFSSVIATLISAPITAYYFSEASLVTVASNLIVVPLVSLAVIGSIILLAVNLALPGAAIVVGTLLDRLLLLIHAVVVWFGQWKFAEAQLSSFTAVHAYIFLGGVISLFFAIRFRVARIAAAGIVALAGIVITAGAIQDSSPGPPALELFNSGLIQSAVVNAGPGVVLYRQNRDDSHDEFVEDFLPYLKRHKRPPPQYYIFWEAPYRTERHLDEAANMYPGISFRPVCRLSGEEGVSVWRLYHDQRILPEAPPAIDYADGVVTVQIQNSTRIVFVSGMRRFLRITGHRRQSEEYYIVIIDDPAAFRNGPEPDCLEKTIFVVGRARAGGQSFRGPKWQDRFRRIIWASERLTVRLGNSESGH